MCSDFLCMLTGTFLMLRRIQQNNMGLHVKYPLFMSDFNETWIFFDKFSKSTNTSFHENLSGRSRVVPCRRTDRWTGMTKLVVAFCNFAKVPRNLYQVVLSHSNGGCIVWKKVWESNENIKRKKHRRMEKKTRTMKISVNQRR